MANLSELIRQKEQQTEEWQQRKADERDIEPRARRLARGLKPPEILADRLAAVPRQPVPEPRQKDERQQRRRERPAREQERIGLEESERTPELGQVLREIVEHFKGGSR